MERRPAPEQFGQRGKTAGAALDDAYGVKLYNTLEELSGRQVQLGPTESMLARLDAKGLVSAWTMPDRTRRGSRPQRSYKVKQIGVAALSRSAPTAASVCAVLNRCGERIWTGTGELTG